MNDFVIESTEDGRIKVQTGEFDAATHRNADKLVELLIALGSVEEVEKVKKTLHTHTHKQGEVHKHGN